MFLGGICIVASFLLTTQASATVFSSFEECLSKSGIDYYNDAGELKSDIDSVTWACETKMRNNTHGYNVCALWIAGIDNPRKAEINFDYSAMGSGFDENTVFTAPLGFYGMCTDNTNHAVDVRITNPPGQDFIDDNNVDFERGLFLGLGGALNGVIKYDGLNINKFLDGATAETMADGRVRYTRNVKVNRCHGVWNGSQWVSNGSCSSMDVPISIVLQNITPRIYAQSNVGSGTRYASTGVVGSSASATMYTSANVGENVEIRFSHNIFSSTQRSGINWRLNRNFPSSSVNFVSMNQGKSGGTNENFNIRSGVFYVPVRDYTDGVYRYIARDTYTVNFARQGNYRFCETVSVEGISTEVCIVVNVGGVEVSDCDAWTPASYTSSYLDANNNGRGTTSVVSKVKNGTLGGDYVNSVYAKPTDNINWIHCYYPGIQKIASALATSSHGSHSQYLADGSTTPNTNINMSQLYTWGNSFSVTSSVDKGSNFRNPNYTSTGNYRSGTLTPTIYNGGRYAIGNSDVKSLLDNTYNVEYGSGRNKAGATLTENNRSSSPTFATVWNEYIHTWRCNYEESCDQCGSYSCNCVSCNCHEVCSGEGENQSCHNECDTCCDTCCYSCAWGHCEHSNNYYGSTCNGSDTFSSASVLVPYNFINTATIQLSSSIVYAGETATIGSAYAEVRTRTNNTLQGTYATQVDDARVEFVAYLSSDSGGSAIVGVKGGKDYDICSALGNWEACTKLADRDTTLNNNGALGLGSSQNTRVATDSLTALMGSTYNVYDATAGKYYCVVAAVYPYTVNGDLDMSASGSNNWYVSAPSCAVIAKKPSLEVWGSGLYTAGKIFTASAEKRVVNGFVNFTPQSSIDTTVFGSWVETNIIANGQVAGLASGAATGFPGSTTRTLTSGSNKLSGSKEGSTRRFCTYRSPLTMPNSGCITSTGGLPGVNTGAVGSSNAGMNKPVDRDALISRFMTNDGTFKYNNTYTRLSQLVSELGSNTIPAGQNQTYVIDAANNDAANKTFTIDTNIQYAEVYNNFVDIPKLIIRADNININCNVTRIDAVLIADKLQSGSIAGNVNTCANSVNVNDAARFNQLKINGAIITGSLTANRTYGAGIGAYSVIPAEIVDYDTSLYLWGAPRADASASGKLDVIYLRELPPRL